MPCYITGSAEGDAQLEEAEAIKEAQKVTRLLCMACEEMEDKNLCFPSQLEDWWTQHKEIDRNRKLTELSKEDKQFLEILETVVFDNTGINDDATEITDYLLTNLNDLKEQILQLYDSYE